MMSNKWAFSLTSLITILALAFVATPAMAQFGTTFSVDDAEGTTPGDVSYADGVQVTAGFTLNVKFDKVVNFVAATPGADGSGASFGVDDLMFTAYNAFGGTLAAPAAPTAINPATSPNGMDFTVEIAVPTAGTTRLHISIAKGAVELADHLAEGGAGARKDAGKNAETSIWIDYVGAAEGTGNDLALATPAAITAGQPTVYMIARGGNELRPVTEATFDAIITLSEEPRKDGFKKDHIDVTNATAGDPTLLDKIPTETAGVTTNKVATGRDAMLYRYVVTITPKYENKNDIVIKVKKFYDQEKAVPKMYMPPSLESGYVEGVNRLTVKVGKEDLKAKTAGIKVDLPKEKYIPGSGFLVVAEDIAGSSVHKSEQDIKDPPKAHQRTPAEMKYNTITEDIPNLETHLANGGTIGVMSPHALVITEIMWGSDAGLDPPSKSQWIELYNAGAGYQTQDGDNTTYLIFYGPGEAPTTGLQDLVGTVDDTAGYWSLAGKGQSGRTQEKVAGSPQAGVVTTPLVSMIRVMGADGTPEKGTLASSWVQSTPPSLNFDADRLGVHIGTPRCDACYLPRTACTHTRTRTRCCDSTCGSR